MAQKTVTEEVLRVLSEGVGDSTVVENVEEQVVNTRVADVFVGGGPAGPQGETGPQGPEGPQGPAGADGQGVTDHQQLTGRSDADTHPISAITNLQQSLDVIDGGYF